MLVSLEGSDGLERRLKIQVPAERVEQEVDSRLKRVGKGAKLKGFRPGKAPIKVIRQHYGDQVRREVLGELLQTSYQEAISQENLNPAGGPRIEPQSMEPGKDLEYTAVIELYPEIDLAGLEKIEVERSAADINDSDLDAMLENLRKQRAEWVEVDRAAEDGDRVNIDFEGRIDDELFDGGSGEDVTVEVGAKKMLPDFEAGLVGLKKDEERNVDVQFPDDYGNEETAGKKAVFKITAKSVTEAKLPEMDAEFCQSYGVESGELDELKTEVRSNMEREMTDVVQRQVRQQIVEQVVSAVEFDLPSTLVEEETTRLVNELKSRQGENAPDLDRNLFKAEAERRVKLGLIVAEVIRGEEIAVDKERVQSKVEELAAGYQEPEEIVRAYMGNPQLLQQIESTVLEDQAFEWLLEQAKVSDKETTFKELMHFEQ